MSRYIMVFDPVPCKGGSKKVAQSVLSACHDDKITVESNDTVSWLGLSMTTLPLCKSTWVINQEQGVGYLLKHFILSLTLIFYIIRFGRPSKLLGISGPTVDLTIYIIGWLFRCEVVQLIQGNVSSSSVSGFCLNKAKAVFYLQSTECSIKKALSFPCNSKLSLASKFHYFINSVDPKQISVRKETHSVGILWAGSLQNWKRVDTFVDAFQQLQQSPTVKPISYYGNICFIGDLNNDLAIKTHHIDALTLYQDPENFDSIRSNADIFVSTSINEPFGLAILESMLAGLVIVIPGDNAYWDKQLTHRVNCIKYEPGNTVSLNDALVELIDDQDLRNKLTKNSQQIAQQYTSFKYYQRIANCITD